MTSTESMELKRLKEQMEGLVLKVRQVEEERDRKDREMEDIRGEQEMLQRRLRDQEHQHATQRGMEQHIFQSSPQGISIRPPKFPLSATKALGEAHDPFPAGAGVRIYHTAQH